MKTLIYIFIFLLMPFCSLAQSDNYLMLFIDKSISVKAQNKQQSNFIYPLIKKYCFTDNATIEVRFLFENSATISSKVFSYQAPNFSADNFRKEDVTLQKQLHASKVKRYRRKFAKSVVNYIASFESNAKQTEIVSAFVPIARNRSKQLKVVFISDMLESSRRFRYMDTYPFTSEKKALLGSKRDIQKLLGIFNVAKKRDKSIEIHCVLPVPTNTQQKAFQFVEIYWRSFFNFFGIPNHQIKFSTI